MIGGRAYLEREGSHRRQPVGRWDLFRQLMERIDRLNELVELHYMNPPFVATLVEEPLDV